jgi:hypothetical protein
MKTKGTLLRREFLMQATGAAAAVAVGEGVTSADAQAEAPKQAAGIIPTRTLGKTG